MSSNAEVTYSEGKVHPSDDGSQPRYVSYMKATQLFPPVSELNQKVIGLREELRASLKDEEIAVVQEQVNQTKQRHESHNIGLLKKCRGKGRVSYGDNRDSRGEETSGVWVGLGFGSAAMGAVGLWVINKRSVGLVCNKRDLGLVVGLAAGTAAGTAG
ncbi:hypothetical protein Tco_0671708, partial [Tanacetum coccineum]